VRVGEFTGPEGGDGAMTHFLLRAAFVVQFGLVLVCPLAWPALTVPALIGLLALSIAIIPEETR
jgi:glucose dehydrogenase